MQILLHTTAFKISSKYINSPPPFYRRSSLLEHMYPSHLEIAFVNIGLLKDFHGGGFRFDFIAFNDAQSTSSCVDWSDSNILHTILKGFE